MDEGGGGREALKAFGSNVISVGNNLNIQSFKALGKSNVHPSLETTGF